MGSSPALAATHNFLTEKLSALHKSNKNFYRFQNTLNCLNNTLQYLRLCVQSEEQFVKTSFTNATTPNFI